MRCIFQVLPVVMMMNMIIILLKPHQIWASANSWEINSQININITSTNQCVGSVHDCLIADHIDADLYMNSHISRMLIDDSKLTPGTKNEKQPAVPCPIQKKYTSCLGDEKTNPAKQQCSIYNRDPTCN